MFAELNAIAKNYEYLIGAVGAILPFAVTAIMAFIAFEQYKINQHLEYSKFTNDLIEEFENGLKGNVDEFIKTLRSNEQDIDKQELILKFFADINSKIGKYEHIIEYSDAQLLKESFNDLKIWIAETKNYKWNFKEIRHSFDVVTKFLAFVNYADSCYISRPNKNITIYALLGLSLKKIYTLFMPYFLQKKLKRYLYPKIFRVKAFFFLISLGIGMFNILFKKSHSKNKKEPLLVVSQEVQSAD